MDAIALLIGDHNRVRGLFSRFKAAKESDDLATARELAELIFEQLDVHASIEESTFYPQVRDASDETREMVAEGLAEHDVAKQVMEECRSGALDDEQWMAKMSVLIENVEHHAGEEESELFPEVRKALGAERLATLGDELTAAKKELGAPTPDLVLDLTKEELLEKARAQDIPGRSSMDHEELALAVDPRF